MPGTTLTTSRTRAGTYPCHFTLLIFLAMGSDYYDLWGFCQHNMKIPLPGHISYKATSQSAAPQSDVRALKQASTLRDSQSKQASLSNEIFVLQERVFLWRSTVPQYGMVTVKSKNETQDENDLFCTSDSHRLHLSKKLHRSGR